MVYLVIVSVRIQNYLHTVLFFHQLIVSSSSIALKDTVLRNPVTGCLFDILSTRLCSVYSPGNNVVIPVSSNASAHLLAGKDSFCCGFSAFFGLSPGYMDAFLCFQDIGFIRFNQVAQHIILYRFFQKGKQLLAHEKCGCMADRDMLRALIKRFQRKRILDDFCARPLNTLAVSLT